MQLVSKSMLMAKVAAGGAHECFDHPDTGIYDVTLMREAALRGEYGEPFQSDLTQHHIDFLKANRDWERSRIRALQRDPRKPWLEPVLCIANSDGTHLQVDGTHRILLRWKLGLRNFLFFQIPIEKALRPSANFVTNPFFDWGMYEQRPDGLYHRVTGKKLMGEEWKG